MVEMQEKLACQYCGKEFRKPSTLSVHICEQKRRWRQEKETGVQLGLQAFLKFYEMTQGSAKTKSYKDFVISPYYSAFVKFGQYLVQVRAISIPKFVEWLIRQNKKLDYWTKEQYYDEFLLEYLRKEHPTDALERSLLEMQRWADEHNKYFYNIFREGSPNRICNMLLNGRISPWVIYNCDSGTEMLARLDGEQILLIWKVIEADFWQRKFRDFLADTEFIKATLSSAKL